MNLSGMRHWAIGAVGFGLALSGCTGSSEPESTPTPETSAGSEQTQEQVQAQGELQALPGGGGVSCLEKDASPTSLLQPRLRAVGGPVTLVGVRIESSPAVRIDNSQVVLLRPRSNPTSGLGTTLDDRWPMAFDAEDRKRIVVRSRGEVEGYDVPQGRYVAPLLQFTVGPDASTFTAITIRYSTADGTKRSVSAPIGMELSDEPCRI
ncbi:hypothetical protein GCM10027020_33300 [Nocardioides salsibiostraticola]